MYIYIYIYIIYIILCSVTSQASFVYYHCLVSCVAYLFQMSARDVSRSRSPRRTTTVEERKVDVNICLEKWMELGSCSSIDCENHQKKNVHLWRGCGAFAQMVFCRTCWIQFESEQSLEESFARLRCS